MQACFYYNTLITCTLEGLTRIVLPVLFIQLSQDNINIVQFL